MNQKPKHTNEFFHDTRGQSVKVLGDYNRNPHVKSKNYIESIKLSSQKNENFCGDTEKTSKISNENIYSSCSKNKEICTTEKNNQSHKNIKKIKESINEILDESVKNHLEIRRLREKLESVHSLKENAECTRKGILELDVSSIKSSPKKNDRICEQIIELKMQLKDMNNRLLIGEQTISAKSIENYGLKFTIFSLQDQLDMIKQKQEEKRIKQSCCSCSIF